MQSETTAFLDGDGMKVFFQRRGAKIFEVLEFIAIDLR